MDAVDENDIAIVGMAIRVAGARNPDEYWNNLKSGQEQVVTYTDEELAARGIPKRSLRDPNYVKAGVPLQDVEQFDPEFFGFSPKEAGILDPQHRQFYEVAWEALERAGHTPNGFDGAIGVFAGCGMGAYFSFNLLTNPGLVDNVGLFLLRHTGNDKDFLATRVSYAFNLKGPSVNVQTACSTSLVATHLAVQSLLSLECDMALAGGVTIEVPHQVGYLYKEGEVLSPDGHCRPFDHESKGTVFGSGTGVVALRRLTDAIADGDHIHAVIKGSAINNDGSNKVGYLAPSVEGQAAAVAEALAVADVEARTIGYVECHGTGTPVGDPIEISALSRAFQESSSDTGYCRIGSVKSNIGHLDTAAGVASLIKAALILENGQIPPSLNFDKPNPNIDFERSPFEVATELQKMQTIQGVRRAAVNSLGVGGTNAFVILEEAPIGDGRPEREASPEFLTISARTRKSLDAYAEKLSIWLRENPDISLSDLSFSLQQGREQFEYRKVLACQSAAEAAELLADGNPRRIFSHVGDNERSSLVFLFPGGGAQYFQMGRDLYDHEEVFRTHVDNGLNRLKAYHGVDLRPIFHAKEEDRASVVEALDRPSIQLPLTFIVEYALAKLWESYGVIPAALIGHSMGENTAACIAGVMSFEETLGLILLRGQLFEQTPQGGVLSVPLAAGELESFLGPDLDLAASNSPGLSVASGPPELLDKLATRLSDNDVDSQRVRVNVAAHSRLLDGILNEFKAHLEGMTLTPPQIPIMSNHSGAWLSDEEACSPAYWVAHLRNTIKFADGISALLNSESRTFLEVGPGNSLGSFVRQNPDAPVQRVISAMRHADDVTPDHVYFKCAVGRLLAAGQSIEREKLFPADARRIPLPTYAFQHAPYWIEPGHGTDLVEDDREQPARIEEVGDWFFEPKWVQQGIEEIDTTPKVWLLFENQEPVTKAIADHLENLNHTVIRVTPGDIFRQVDTNSYSLAPESGIDGYDALLAALLERDLVPDRIVHAWLLTWDTSYRPGSTFFHRIQNHGFYSLFYLAKAIGKRNIEQPIGMTVIANDSQVVDNEPIAHPDKATALGPALVIPRELPNLFCKFVDVRTGRSASAAKRAIPQQQLTSLIDSLGEEILGPVENAVVAWRKDVRFTRRVVKSEKKTADKSDHLLKKRGVYLVTGGFGGIATVLTDWLAKEYEARLVLLARTPLPHRQDWDRWLVEHDKSDSISVAIDRMRTLEANGVEVLHIAADTTVSDQMQEAVKQIEERFGELNGVFHTAGVTRDSLIATKTQREIEDVFSAKVYGTLVLDNVLKGIPLDFVTIFSSSSAYVAPQGQIDYVGANSFVNAFADACKATHEYPVLALNWGIWRDVGIAAANRVQAPDFETSKPTAYELFDLHHVGRDGMREIHHIEGTLSSEHWVIDDHRLINGDALLPGTGYIEMIRAALSEVGNPAPWRIQNLIFEQPLFVRDGEVRQFRIDLVGNRDDWRIEISAVADMSKDVWTTCVRAQVLKEQDVQPVAVSASALRDRCTVASETAGGTQALRTRQEDHLRFGPRWQVLRQMHLGESEAYGRLRMDDQHVADLDTFEMHPGVLDIATGFAMDLIPGYADQEITESLWVPISYGGVSFYRPLTAELVSWVRLSEESAPSSGFVSFDVTLMDGDDNVLVKVTRLTLRRTEERFTMTSPVIDVVQAGTDKKNLTPGEIALEHNLANGIDAASGISTLRELFSKSLPAQISVSSIDIKALIRQADYLVTASTATDSSKFDRPALDSEFEAPRDEIEVSLAAIWEKLLGVEGVGVHDSFFDLGGHSLIAVRLFNDIREKFGNDLPMSVLMQSPTINDLAEILRGGAVNEVGDSGEPTETGERVAEAIRFQHVVPMHSGPVGGATPLFMVAGMFGNVLNLSHLAHLLGEERPFYALQARGLYGDSEPHESFEDMAKDYIAEIREVQPEGPYFLGGYSGGGLVAWEIARQLVDAGDHVLRVVMLDTPAPSFPQFTLWDKASMIMQGFSENGPGYFIEKVKTRIQWEKEKRAQGADHTEDPQSFQSEKIGEAFIRALRAYQVPNLSVPVSILRPKLNIRFKLSGGRQVDAERNYVFEDNGWSPFVEDLEIIEVPGTHDSMVLEPNVRVLVSSIRRVVAKAESKNGES